MVAMVRTMGGLLDSQQQSCFNPFSLMVHVPDAQHPRILPSLPSFLTLFPAERHSCVVSALRLVTQRVLQFESFYELHTGVFHSVTYFV